MNRIELLAAGLLGLALSGPVLALSSDANQPAHIEADRVDYDQTSGIMHYRGHVQVTQGSMHATAATATVYTTDGALTKIDARGRPVTYRQRPDGKPKDVHGRGRRMEYFADTQKVILYDHAELEQGGNILKSQKIVYDAVRDVATAGSGGKPAASGQGGGDRVRITLQPRKPADGAAPASPAKPDKPTR